MSESLAVVRLRRPDYLGSLRGAEVGDRAALEAEFSVARQGRIVLALGDVEADIVGAAQRPVGGLHKPRVDLSQRSQEEFDISSPSRGGSLRRRGHRDGGSRSGRRSDGHSDRGDGGRRGGAPNEQEQRQHGHEASHLRIVAAVLLLLVVGVLAWFGFTPVIPQSVVIAGFFIGGPVVLMQWAWKRSRVTTPDF